MQIPFPWVPHQLSILIAASCHNEDGDRVLDGAHNAAGSAYTNHIGDTLAA